MSGESTTIARPYAEAIAAGEADINQCPPGGQATIQALADLLGRDPVPPHPELIDRCITGKVVMVTGAVAAGLTVTVLTLEVSFELSL